MRKNEKIEGEGVQKEKKRKEKSTNRKKRMKSTVQNWVVVTSEFFWRFQPSRDVTFLLSDQWLQTFRTNLVQPIFKVQQSKSNRSVYLWKAKVNFAGPGGRAVCGRSPAETVGLNPTGGINICLLWTFCVVWGLGEKADHTFRGVLPTVVLRCVWPKNL